MYMSVLYFIHVKKHGVATQVLVITNNMLFLDIYYAYRVILTKGEAKQKA